MTPTLVCPFDRKLIGSLMGRRLVVHTTDISLLPAISRVVSESNQLHCVLCEADAPLAALELPPGIGEIHTALRVSALGTLVDAMPRIRRLKGRPVRVYLPPERAESYAEARVLASLGVHSGIWLSPRGMDWDRLDDLLHYAAYGNVEHGTIEPFENALGQKERDAKSDPAATIFDDARGYLHVAADGRVALSRKELEAGEYIGEVSAVDELLADPRYVERSSPYGECFMRFEGCSVCAGWKACLGRFSAEAPECRGFFTNLVEAAETRRKKMSSEIAIWRA